VLYAVKNRTHVKGLQGFKRAAVETVPYPVSEVRKAFFSMHRSKRPCKLSGCRHGMLGALHNLSGQSIRRADEQSSCRSNASWDGADE